MPALDTKAPLVFSSFVHEKEQLMAGQNLDALWEELGKLDLAGLPVAGAKTARRVLHKALPSNALIRNRASSESNPL